MALPQLPAHVVHKLGQHSRVIQEFLSTREYAKESRTNAVRLFSCIRSILSSMCIPPISFQIIFFQGPLTRWGRNSRVSLTSFGCLSMFRLPKPYCALRSQHLLSQMLFFVYCSRMIFGCFFPKKHFS